MTDTLAKQAEILADAPRSTVAFMERRVEQTPDLPAFLVPDRAAAEPEWHSYTYREFRDHVHAAAAALLALGLQHGARVAIASSTRYEWIVASMGIAAAGGCVTSVYPNCTDHDELYILQDSGARVLVAENQSQVAKVQLHDDELYDQLAHIVILDDDRKSADRVDQRVITWAELGERGRLLLEENPSAVDDAIAAVGPDDLSTLIYTSGTTGRPKGVELTHRAIVFDGLAMGDMDFLTTDDVQYLWLPLSHVFGNCLLAAQWAYGFSTAVDGRPDRLLSGLAAVRPTVMCGVPRIFEKVRAGVITKAPASGVQARIARWAFSVGRETLPYRYEDKGQMPRGLKRRFALADRLVFSKLRDVMGGRVRFFISGGARLSPQVLDWFAIAGLPIVEGYGSTESTISVLNPPLHPRFGSVGPTVPGVEARIADDGELLLRGPLVMRGYHGAPEKTDEVLTDGWLHTADIATIDEDGYIFITDRKKDMIKTSGGKYVAPQKVENAIAANIPYVSQALVFGEQRKYVVALLTLDEDSLMKWGRNHGHPKATYEELSQLPEVHQSIERYMERANSKLERWETVKRFTILDHELSMEDGTVTATAKARRTVIARKYGHIIDAMYDAD